MSKNGWAFTLSIGLMVILWFLFQRRGRTIDKLLLDAQVHVTRNEIKRLTKELETNATAAKIIDYNRLRSEYRELVARLGLRVVPPVEPNTKGNPTDH